MIPHYTIIDAFINANKDRDDIIGDLCQDVLRDKKFPKGNYLEQLEYLRWIGVIYPEIQDAVMMFYNELENFKSI